MTPLERLKDDLSRRTDKYEHVVVACDDLAKLLAVAEAAVRVRNYPHNKIPARVAVELDDATEALTTEER